MTPEQNEIRELRKKLQCIETEIKKGYHALDVRLPEQFSITGKFRAHEYNGGLPPNESENRFFVDRFNPVMLRMDNAPEFIQPGTRSVALES